MATRDGEPTPGRQFDVKMVGYFQELRNQTISRRGLFRATAGAAGAAVQCFNLMAGFPEEEGLRSMPLFP